MTKTGTPALSVGRGCLDFWWRVAAMGLVVGLWVLGLQMFLSKTTDLRRVPSGSPSSEQSGVSAAAESVVWETASPRASAAIHWAFVTLASLPGLVLLLLAFREPGYAPLLIGGSVVFFLIGVGIFLYSPVHRRMVADPESRSLVLSYAYATSLPARFFPRRRDSVEIEFARIAHVAYVRGTRHEEYDDVPTVVKFGRVEVVTTDGSSMVLEHNGDVNEELARQVAEAVDKLLIVIDEDEEKGP